MANGADDPGRGTVTPITTATNTPGKPIRVGSGSYAIATPDGKTVYVTSFAEGTVTPITTATNTPGKPIKVGNEPFALVDRALTTSRTP